MARISIVSTGGTRAPTQLALLERFLADGHEVRCIASTAALRFLTSYLVRRPRSIARYLKHFRPELLERAAYYIEKPKSVPHIEEGHWADVMVMAPATCNSVGKLVSGISDNYPLLAIRALPRTKKCIVVPSMNPEMWFDPHFQRNVDLLNATEKYRVLCPSRGKMLSGDFGIGAQVNFEDIIDETYRVLGIGDTGVSAFLEGRAGDVPWDDSPISGRAQRPQIVLVDEDETLTSTLKRQLLSEYPSFKVARFPSPKRAIEWMTDNPPAMVVTELHFSTGATGHDLIEWLRGPGAPDIPILAVTEGNRAAVGAERLARQEVMFVPKPLNLPFVVGMVGGSVQGQAKGRGGAGAVTRSLRKGEVLFHEGDPGHAVYVIRSGELKVSRTKNGKIVELARLGPRRMVGEMAFFGRAPRAGTVEALEDSELVELDLERFRDYLDGQPAWLRVTLDSLVEHLREAGYRISQSPLSEGEPSTVRFDRGHSEPPTFQGADSSGLRAASAVPPSDKQASLGVSAIAGAHHSGPEVPPLPEPVWEREQPPMTVRIKPSSDD